MAHKTDKLLTDIQIVHELTIVWSIYDCSLVHGRSPYLVMLNGVMLLSIIGAFAYNSENVLVGRFPVNLEHLFIVSA